MRHGYKSASAIILALAQASPAAPEVGPHALTDLSQRLLHIYNRADASELHELLAPSLRAKYPVEALREALTRCRVLTHDIFRLSTPTWGARRFGFFAVYAEVGTFEMILEIDENEKLVHWVITDDVTSKTQQCTISNVPS